MPFRAETTRSYVEKTTDEYEQQVRQDKGLPPRAQPINVNTRALYNQSFDSVYAMVPGDMMLLLMLIPSMLTALSVVREKELGSIANFYAAPATKAEFLLGKQLPYVGHRADPVRDPRRARRLPVPRSDQGQHRRRWFWAGCSMCWRAPASAC